MLNRNVALTNALLGTLGFTGALGNGRIEIRSGSQPYSANSATTGTLLGVITSGGVNFTPETPGSISIVFGGTSGTISNIRVGLLPIVGANSVVTYNGSLSQLATNVAYEINKLGVYRAKATDATVLLTTLPGIGDKHNDMEVIVTVTGELTATMSAPTITGGVSAVGGLGLATPVNGEVTKVGVWNFTGLATGTQGYFRWLGSEDDDGSANSPYPRLDGAIGTSTGEMRTTNLSVVFGAPSTIDSFTLSMLEA